MRQAPTGVPRGQIEKAAGSVHDRADDREIQPVRSLGLPHGTVQCG
ncbi:hypothetical protein [Microvirga tunisiensis]|nr:hypothetical protein [Microvirga tunisiensis]